MTEAPSAPAPVFAACSATRGPSLGVARARHASWLVSAALHLGALLILAATWRAPEPLPAPSVRVNRLGPAPLVAPRSRAPRPEPSLRLAEPATSAGPAAPTPKTQSKPLASKPLASKPRPRLAEPPAAIAAAASAVIEPAAPLAAVTPAPAEPDGRVPRGVRRTADPGINTGSTARSSDLRPPAAGLSSGQTQLYLQRYLQEIFRSRIAARFHYPEEAERLELEGLVVVRVSVLPNGALSDARSVGRCPHRLLCDAAERTVREAAPFPPPPVELGGAISVDVPFHYQLE
jgi:protein TonB